MQITRGLDDTKNVLKERMEKGQEEIKQEMQKGLENVQKCQERTEGFSGENQQCGRQNSWKNERDCST
ncbi:hypothetical protein TNCV_2627901 [Trichonephila clavipes]|nr:hypothetical protein TNCV_2627901 [Trichonephila clavipes]